MIVLLKRASKTDHASMYYIRSVSSLCLCRLQVIYDVGEFSLGYPKDLCYGSGPAHRHLHMPTSIDADVLMLTATYFVFGQ